jgi:hypothetical protein
VIKATLNSAVLAPCFEVGSVPSFAAVEPPVQPTSKAERIERAVIATHGFIVVFCLIYEVFGVTVFKFSTFPKFGDSQERAPASKPYHYRYE